MGFLYYIQFKQKLNKIKKQVEKHNKIATGMIVITGVSLFINSCSMIKKESRTRREEKRQWINGFFIEINKNL